MTYITGSGKEEMQPVQAPCPVSSCNIGNQKRDLCSTGVQAGTCDNLQDVFGHTSVRGLPRPGVYVFEHECVFVHMGVYEKERDRDDSTIFRV